MTTCGDLLPDSFPDLHLAVTPELDPERAETVREHVASCASCAAELTATREAIGMVRQLEIEPTTESRRALMAAVDAELAAESAAENAVAPISFGLRRVWAGALWRYEHSSRFRRLTIASVGMHAAAAGIIAWMMIGPGFQRDRLNVTIDPNSAHLPELDPPVTPEHEDLVEGGPRPFPEAGSDVDWAEFEAATADGVVLPPVMETPALRNEGADLRFPTTSIMIQLRAVMDHEDRDKQLSQRLPEVAPRASSAVARGLDWLASRRADDGRWGPVPAEGEVDLRDGVTGAVVLAFVQDGRSAARGDHADLLTPAIDSLTRRLRDGAETRDDRPLYAHTLALRALTWQWALDFRHMTLEQRRERQDLLEKAGRELVAWQSDDGGFGYTPDDSRTDASCTLFAVAALSDLRKAGVLRADKELEKAGRFLAGLRGDGSVQGYQQVDDRDGDLTLTAGLLAYARAPATRAALEPLVARVEAQLADRGRSDALLAWSGIAALQRLGVARDADRFGASVDAVISGQRDDGAWPSAEDRHCRLGGDELTTAFGVLAVTRVYLP